MSSEITRDIGSFVSDKVLMGEEVARDTAFIDLGLDSLVLLELTAMLNKQYRVGLTEDDLLAAGTIEGAAALVESRRPVTRSL